MSLSTISVPHFCEADTGNLIAEPINALSSLAFLAVALLGLRLWFARGGDRGSLFVVLAAGAVGVSSLAFHTARLPVALIAEVLSITVFVLAVFALILMRIFGQGLAMTATHLVGFVALSAMVALMLTPRAFGYGSIYVVPLLTMYVLGAALVVRARMQMHGDRDLRGQLAARSDRRVFRDIKTGYALILAGLLTALALVARSFDAAACGSLPIGLHAVWHLLVSCAVYVLIVACIDYLPARSVRSTSGAI